MKVHLDITVKGLVQGVGFRYHTLRVAIDLGICGNVRNHSDRSVQIEAEGEKEDIDTFVKWCYSGPQNAIINEVIVNPGKVCEYKHFTIL